MAVTHAREGKAVVEVCARDIAHHGGHLAELSGRAVAPLFLSVFASEQPATTTAAATAAATAASMLCVISSATACFYAS